MRDQHELALRCLEVEQAGEDVYEYLKGQGFISPRATWQRLQLNELGRRQSEVDKGEIMKQKITDEQRNEAVKMAVNGTDPRKYLAQCGSNAPEKLWAYIKKVLKEKDPALYERIPDFRHTAKKKQTDETAIVKSEVPEKPKICQPVNYDGMMVRAVEGDFGSYHFQEINGKQWIDYDDKELSNQLSMTVEQWKGFLKEIYHAAQILGVSL